MSRIPKFDENMTPKKREEKNPLPVTRDPGHY